MKRLFIAESNRIEGIIRPPTALECKAHETLWALDRVTVADLEAFVDQVASAPLRRHRGQDVRVGHHIPPRGGLEVERALGDLLYRVETDRITPYLAHRAYETLHPFMDGNGRSGRALWAWQMMRDGKDPFALPFLHAWYYQSLDGGR